MLCRRANIDHSHMAHSNLLVYKGSGRHQNGATPTRILVKRFDPAPQVHALGVNRLVMALEIGIQPAATHF